MAKKKTDAKTANKSDAIREILKAKPTAGLKEIRAGLEERGVKASDALISKIKYGRKPSSGRKKRAAGTNGKTRGSKADAIRGAFEQLGSDARSRDVIASLRKRGIAVSSAQVSTLRKFASARGGFAAGAGQSLSLGHLFAAKQLAERVGGIEAAQQALASLARLLES